MEEKYRKFYMMFDKRFKNLILCSNTLCDSGVRQTELPFKRCRNSGKYK